MKSDRPKIPVEPLSDARWAKLDESLFSALDRVDREGPADVAARPSGSRRLFFAVGAAGAVAAVAAALLVAFARGPAPRGEIVLNPSHIETGATPSRLALGESTIEVGPSSAVVASGDDAHGILVVVEKGQVDCEVTPRKDRPPFVVQAGNVRVRVVGTRFVVVRDVGAVRVTVAHGKVEVSRGADVTVLSDGESWPPLGSATSAVTSSGTSSATTPEAAPAPSAPSAPSPPSAEGTAPALRAPRPTPSTAPVDPQRAYEAAARSEAADPDGAMAAYRRLASSGGAWAPTALFAAGRLASERGRKAEAKPLLEDYLARHPRGANAEDARRILARLR